MKNTISSNAAKHSFSEGKRFKDRLQGCRWSGIVTVAAILFSLPAAAGPEYSGRIDEIEVWANGNVDFTISPAATDCGQVGRFIINYSMPGAKSLIAALYMAKAQERLVRIYSYGCIVADNYNAVTFIGTSYLYLKQ